MEIVFFSETVGSLKSDDDRFMQVFFCLRHHGLIGFNRYPVVAVGLVRMDGLVFHNDTLSPLNSRFLAFTDGFPL